VIIHADALFATYQIIKAKTCPNKDKKRYSTKQEEQEKV
jgi:hypothetical protein